MPRKSLKLILLLLALNFKMHAQVLKETEIIGTWKVLNIGTIKGASKEEKNAAKQLINAFHNAKFKFTEDRHFSFDFEIEDMSIRNGYWKLNNSSKTYIIQDQKDKTAILMEIDAKKVNGKILFKLSETLIVLEVEKEY